MAILLGLRAASASRGLPRNREDLIAEFYGRYDWSIDLIALEKALRSLERKEFLSVTKDKYAGESLRFQNISSDDALLRKLDDQDVELFSKGKLGGVAWFKEVFHNPNFWSDLDGDILMEVASHEENDYPNTSVELDIPASNRIVRLDDNRPTVELLASDLKSLAEEIRENNLASNELGDERTLVNGEILAAEVLVGQPAFRLGRLYSLVIPTLRFLADKFASGAIGEMAKRIIALIIGLA
jgi:hypothetical protein